MHSQVSPIGQPLMRAVDGSAGKYAGEGGLRSEAKRQSWAQLGFPNNHLERTTFHVHTLSDHWPSQ